MRGVLGGVGRGHRGWCWRCCCGQWGGMANRVSCCTFAARPSKADLSAWRRSKLARGGLWGPSVALGVIPPLCATLGPVLAGPEGCSRGRWRSGPSKWRHTAAPEGRGQGAPRTCRCIETNKLERGLLVESSQGAPRTCRCIETDRQAAPKLPPVCVREHHAPVGALRRWGSTRNGDSCCSQGAPRTCRCIETDGAPVGLFSNHMSGSTTNL